MKFFPYCLGPKSYSGHHSIKQSNVTDKKQWPKWISFWKWGRLLASPWISPAAVTHWQATEPGYIYQTTRILGMTSGLPTFDYFWSQTFRNSLLGPFFKNYIRLKPCSPAVCSQNEVFPSKEQLCGIYHQATENRVNTWRI